MKSGTCHCCAIGKRFVINCWQRKHQFIVRIIKLQTLRMYLRRDDCRHSLSACDSFFLLGSLFLLDDVARRGSTIDSPALLLTIELLLQCNYIMEFNCKVVVLVGGGWRRSARTIALSMRCECILPISLSLCPNAIYEPSSSPLWSFIILLLFDNDGRIVK